MKNATLVAKIQIVALLSVVSACALTACGNSSSSNPTPIVTAQAATVAPPELQEMRHRASECPSGIQGDWSTRNNLGLAVSRSYHFEGRTLIEQENTHQYIFDGAIHTMPPENGIYFWYVGACQKKSVRLKLVAIGAKKAVLNVEVYMKGRRLAIAQEMNGYQVPFLQMFERTN